MEILNQALGIIGMVLVLSSFQFRKQKTLIRIQLFSAIIFAVHYLMLGASTGAILNIIGIGRAYVFSNKEHRWAQHKGWVPLFCAAYIAVYVLTFTVFGKEAVSGTLALELLPVIGSIVTVIAFRLDNITMRKLSLINGTSWLIYNIFTGSIGGSLTETFGMASILIGLWRLKKKE